MTLFWNGMKREFYKGFWEGKLIALPESNENPLLDNSKKTTHHDSNWNVLRTQELDLEWSQHDG